MKKSINELRAEATLNKKFKYSEGVMTRREWLNMWRIKGATVQEKQLRNYAAEEKLKTWVENNRHIMNSGNENWPPTKEWREKRELSKLPIYKTEYSLNLPDSSLFDITKTEYDYFKALELAEDINTQKNELSYKIEAGIATNDEIEEDEERDFEFFRKYAND